MVDLKVDFFNLPLFLTRVILICTSTRWLGPGIFVEASTVWLYVLSYHKINQMWVNLIICDRWILWVYRKHTGGFSLFFVCLCVCMEKSLPKPKDA